MVTQESDPGSVLDFETVFGTIDGRDFKKNRRQTLLIEVPSELSSTCKRNQLKNHIKIPAFDTFSNLIPFFTV